MFCSLYIPVYININNHSDWLFLSVKSCCDPTKDEPPEASHEHVRALLEQKEKKEDKTWYDQ